MGKNIKKKHKELLKQDLGESMKKRSIFSASFEESLNLEDDGFLQYQKGNVFSKLETYYR